MLAHIDSEQDYSRTTVQTRAEQKVDSTQVSAFSSLRITFHSARLTVKQSGDKESDVRAKTDADVETQRSLSG
jgi:hypothetical protein